MSLGVDRICVVIGRTRHRMVEAELQEATKRGAKFIELRLDFLARSVDMDRILQHKACPLVATVRRASDGGRWKGSEDERQTLLRQTIAGGHFEWVDLETDVADIIPRFGDVKRIVSYHNMQETPADLEGIYAQMCKQDADVVKIAVTAQHMSDNLRVLQLFDNAPKPTVAHCMGEIGFPSRILALKYGAPFIYAAFNKERNVAPGLPSFRDVQEIYPVEHINAQTDVFAVAGDPVGHSLSPHLHNKMYRQLGVNAIYLPFRIQRGEFRKMIEELASIPVQGYSVTIPHKEAAAAIAIERDETVEQTRAANTLIRLPSRGAAMHSRGEGEAEKKAKGFRAVNTDYHAVLGTLAHHLPNVEPENPKFLANQSVLILGAGGVARAIAYAVKSVGAHVTIASRTLERAVQLAEEVRGKAIDWKARHNSDVNILINGTPIGMQPRLDESPIHNSFLKPGLNVFDTVYTPENTLLIKEARARGCLVITGVEMFVRQAALQFKLFTGKEAPLEDLRDALREAISPLTRRDDD